LSLDVWSIARSLGIVKLTDEQKETIIRWADEDGINMGDIQSRLKTELGISVTYLETRFLLEDHGIELKPPAPEEEEDDAEADLNEVEALLAGDDLDDLPMPGGKVTVTVDTVTVPQAMASGKVTFSDGGTALWYVDQMGRLGLDPATPGYRPSEGDIVAFQRELQRAMG
jgi:hypothetical protein